MEDENVRNKRIKLILADLLLFYNYQINRELDILILSDNLE